MQLDYKNTSDNIIIWISKTLHEAGFKKVVIGLSGGIDSALSATLVVKALGKENVYVVMLPYGKLSAMPLEDAQLVANFLAIPKENREVIDIKKSVDVIASASPPVGSAVRLGNIMARVRMIYLFDLAKKLPALVCGTENKTEHYLGYFTRFGDSASDIEPIQSLYKTQVWEMAQKLRIPEEIIKKTPTAGLWENQTDESELGFTYKEADKVLYYFFDKKISGKEIFNKGISKEVIESVLKRVRQNEFKHKLPYVFI